MATSWPTNLTTADIVTLQRRAGNSAVTGLLTIQRAPAGGSGDGPPAVALPESPQALGTRLGLASKGSPSRFDYIVAGINKANLSAADALQAASSATRELGLRMFDATVGDDLLLCSVQPGTGKPVLIVRPNGMVVRGTADIAVASPPSLERPMVVTNVKPNVTSGGTAGSATATTKAASKPAPATDAPAVKPAPAEVPVLKPKVETTPPTGGAGIGATSPRLGVEASRLRTAGRFLAAEAPGLLLQAILMTIFPPEVRVHNENYGTLNRQKIDPALQRALAEQATTFNKLAADGPTQSIWATVTVESEYRVEATSGGNLGVYLQDLRFIEMKVTRDYLLVEGPKFQVGAGAKAFKKVTYSIPLFGPATRASESEIRRFRTVREGLTSSAYKVRLAAMLAMYRLAEANSFLKNQLVRDLQPRLKDDESIVRKVAARMLGRL